MSLDDTTTPNLPTGPTGLYVVIVAPGAGPTALSNSGGAATALGEAVAASGDTDPTVLENLDMAVVTADSARLAQLLAAVDDPGSPVTAVEPEEYVQVLGHLDTVARGTGDTLQHPLHDTAQQFVGDEDADVEPAAIYADTAVATWGLYAVRAIPPVLFTAPWSGHGTTIAVLDTGIDLKHPDFKGGKILGSQSFVPGQTVQDGHSHGTHCAGTAAGPRVPAKGRRYGVAHGAKLLVGKVLSNSGSGTSGQVLAGINWAIGKNATVVSMSLGSSVALGQLPHAYYEEAALRALGRGVLIVAAAGNSGPSAPVGSPANAPSVLSVGALDHGLDVGNFSCRGFNGAGGEVNVAAPGVNVYSSVPVTKGSYDTMTGTSMAAPHAAGVAAMRAQQTGKRGLALWNELMLTTSSLAPLPALAVGYGQVQAPLRRRPLLPITPPS